MIQKYYCPESIKEARNLLASGVVPIGGGTYVSQNQDKYNAVMNLEKLGFDYIKNEDNLLKIGSTIRLQSLVDSVLIDEQLKFIIKREFNQNIRNAATITGKILTLDGRSNFLAWLICAEAEVDFHEIDDRSNRLPIEDLAQKIFTPGKVIREINFRSDQKIMYETISRTPDDFTQVGVFIGTSTNKDQLTVVVNGGDKLPSKYFLDNKDGAANLLERNLLNSHSHNSNWVSQKYFTDMSKTLLNRLIQRI